MSVDIDIWIRQQVSSSEIISKEHETALVNAWLENHDIKARDELVLAHQKLVAGMATRFSSSGANFSDLFNEGIAALIAAANKFNPEKKCRFATYGAWWVLSHLQEAVHRDIYTVKIGRSRTEKKILRLLGTARNIIGPNLDSSIMATIADFADTDIETIEQIDGAMASRSVSLNSRVGGEGEEGTEVGDMIEDTNATDFGAEAAILNRNQRDLLENYFSRLKDPRAPIILRSRWLSEDEKSLTEIGEQFGVSAERIRQIERDALVQLRSLMSQENANIVDLLT
jgi:RNA polymerase sigma factor (sigma-70 family)